MSSYIICYSRSRKGWFKQHKLAHLGLNRHWRLSRSGSFTINDFVKRSSVYTSYFIRYTLHSLIAEQDGINAQGIQSYWLSAKTETKNLSNYIWPFFVECYAPFWSLSQIWSRYNPIHSYYELYLCFWNQQISSFSNNPNYIRAKTSDFRC